MTDGLTPPSDLHWLGTDQIGRDYLSRLMAGGRVALLVSLTGVSIALVVGTTLGMMAGYLGGMGQLGKVLDDLIMRLTDAMMAVPELLLIAILVLTFGKGNLGPHSHSRHCVHARRGACHSIADNQHSRF